MTQINIGDEFITRSRDDAHGNYILVVDKILKSQVQESDDLIKYSYLKNDKTKRDTAKRWWFVEYCYKIRQRYGKKNS